MTKASKASYSRRNRALRKIRASKHIPPEIKLTFEALIDFLDNKTDGCLAWPSVATLAKRLQKSTRTVRWHLRAIKATGAFKWKHLSPNEAVEYVHKKYGYRISLSRCRYQAPTLYEINNEHPLWDETKCLPREIDLAMRQAIDRVKQRRSCKSTSRLVSDPSMQPKLLIARVQKSAGNIEGVSRTTGFGHLQGVSRKHFK